MINIRYFYLFFVLLISVPSSFAAEKDNLQEKISAIIVQSESSQYVVHSSYFYEKRHEFQDLVSKAEKKINYFENRYIDGSIFLRIGKYDLLFADICCDLWERKPEGSKESYFEILNKYVGFPIKLENKPGDFLCDYINDLSFRFGDARLVKEKTDKYLCQVENN